MWLAAAAAAAAACLQLPEGDWFCSGQCTTIKAQLGALVRAGEMTLGGTKEHSWHVLRGFKHSAGRVSARTGLHSCGCGYNLSHCESMKQPVVLHRNLLLLGCR
jgi:hypothetical protein